jgi:hypothetical protein
MKDLRSPPLSSVTITVTEHAVNGVPVQPTSTVGRDIPPAPPLLAGKETRSGERKLRQAREVRQDRMARLRLLAGSATGVGCLFVAHWLHPDQGSLFGAPSGPVAWTAVICGIAGVWLVPGMWLSAVMMSAGAGPVAWLGTRIGTTLAWYALVGPVIHNLGEGARVTTGGILAATMAATASVSLGVALGLSRWPARPLLRILVAAVIGGVCAQAVIWTSMRVWTDDMDYSHIRRLDWLIVLVCALLVTVGALSRPKLPPVLTARNMRKVLVFMAVVVTTAAALLAMSAKWSPEQRMPSAFGAEQIPAPAGADLAFALTAIGRQGSGLIQRAKFTASDDTGRAVPVVTRLVAADGSEDWATLLVTVQRSSQPELCGRLDFNPHLGGAVGTVWLSKNAPPVKITMRDQASDLLVQAVLPDGWCAG